jgi:hypothetical protein
MITVTFDTKKAEAAVARIRRNVPDAMGRAVSTVMRRHLLPRIIENTPKPPTPRKQSYQRTGRLNRGWKPAADLFNVKSEFPAPGNVPAPEGLGRLDVGSDAVSAIAVNLVPYALAVEIVGPGAIFGRGITPTFKGGVRMVTKAQESLADGNEVRRAVDAEWKKT